MAREVLCSLDELPQGECRIFDVGGFALAAARSGNKVFVLEDRCSHDDGEFEGAAVILADPVRPSNGLVELECPRHGARFDMATGQPTRMPAVAPIEAFTTSIVDGVVYVELPED